MMMGKICFIEGAKDIINELDFSIFINEVSDDFIPPLKQRICISDYYKKLNEFARFVICLNDTKIIGIIAYYCNDYDVDRAYTTLLAILPEYRGKRLGTYLLNMACSYAKKDNKSIMAIETNSEIAKQCYLRANFEIKSFTRLDHNLVRYYMEKKL